MCLRLCTHALNATTTNRSYRNVWMSYRMEFWKSHWVGELRYFQPPSSCCHLNLFFPRFFLLVWFSFLFVICLFVVVSENKKKTKSCFRIVGRIRTRWRCRSCFWTELRFCHISIMCAVLGIQWVVKLRSYERSILASLIISFVK